MPEFLRLLPPDAARSLLLDNVSKLRVETELIGTEVSLHRVTADDISAPHALPEFSRSSVDGYAVRASDTFGATDSQPAYLESVGEIPMGARPSVRLIAGQCAMIHTGGMLPEGADAVAMLEYSEATHDPSAATLAALTAHAHKPVGHSDDEVRVPRLEIEFMRAVAPGENVIKVGDDVQPGQVVISKGTRLRPAEIGGLMALGITSLRVAKRPRVALISSGDEVVDAHRRPGPGQVRDVNAYTLAALVAESGGEPVQCGIIKDERQTVRKAMAEALSASDMLLVSGGSSASTRDMTADAAAALGSPGILVHGINIRPGKPTILAACDGKAVVGLPGNPVSALVIAYLFVVPVIARLLGLPADRPKPRLTARLTVNLRSQAGREDWWPVKLIPPDAGLAEWRAEPIFGKSNLIFSLVAADGLARIAPEANGASAGEIVDVQLM
jgi:molybdopterin molybdotransferase